LRSNTHRQIFFISGFPSFWAQEMGYIEATSLRPTHGTPEESIGGLISRMKYYDLKRHWTKRVEPYLSDPKLQAILVLDFNKFTYGRWKLEFTHGQFPRDFESCDWSWEHRGCEPRFWRYVKHAACHWLVNFNLKLAQLVDPRRPWRILTSDKHSTVWDGDHSLFDFNFLALDVAADDCFNLANEKELPVGKQLKVYFARHFSEA
jgi:hypothetical protein